MTPKERGRICGAYFREQRQDYGKANGHYPSNPYPRLSPEATGYDEGYEEGFRG